MKDIWVRYARNEDIKQIWEWSERIKDLNLADPELINYPTLAIMCAHREGKAILYAPSQQALVLEGLAPSPDASELDIAQALKAIIQAYVIHANKHGIREIYFLCKDERVVKIATRHGFSVMPWTTLCLDTAELERPKVSPVVP